MTQNNTAAAAAPAAEPKLPSKMFQARELLNKIKGETLPEGRSVRQEFIARGQSEIGLTKSGAITYYNNLKSEAAGKALYPHSGKKASKPAADAPAEATGENKAEADAEAEATA